MVDIDDLKILRERIEQELENKTQELVFYLGRGAGSIAAIKGLMWTINELLKVIDKLGL